MAPKEEAAPEQGRQAAGLPQPRPVGAQPRPNPAGLLVETLWPSARASAGAKAKFQGGPPASTYAASSAAASSVLGPLAVWPKAAVPKADGVPRPVPPVTNTSDEEEYTCDPCNMTLTEPTDIRS
eukprot:9454622-Pyramimonas_sp.AAC.1